MTTTMKQFFFNHHTYFYDDDTKFYLETGRYENKYTTYMEFNNPIEAVATYTAYDIENGYKKKRLRMLF